MTARHRVSKLLLRHGRVYPESSTWTLAHRRWLARQQFRESASELTFADLLAATDGLTARKAALAERLSRLALEEQWWPTVARLRCFRGVDMLTAFALHLELGGDWQRFERAPALSAWLGLVPSLSQSGETQQTGVDHEDRLDIRAATARRGRLAQHTPTADRRHPEKPPARPARPRLADRQPRSAATPSRAYPDARPRQARQRDRRRVRTRAGLLSVGRRDRRLTLADNLTGRQAGAPSHTRPARANVL